MTSKTGDRRDVFRFSRFSSRFSVFPGFLVPVFPKDETGYHSETSQGQVRFLVK